MIWKGERDVSIPSSPAQAGTSPHLQRRPKWEPQGRGHGPIPAFQGPTSVLSRYSRNSLKRGTRVVIHHPLSFRVWLGVLHRARVRWRWFPIVPTGHPPPPAGPLQLPDHSQPRGSQGAMWAGLPVTHGIKPNTVPIKWSPWSPEHDLKPKQVTKNSPGPSGLETTEGPLSAMNPIRNSNPRSERFKYTEEGTRGAKVRRRHHSPQGVTDGSSWDSCCRRATRHGSAPNAVAYSGTAPPPPTVEENQTWATGRDQGNTAPGVPCHEGTAEGKHPADHSARPRHSAGVEHHQAFLTLSGPSQAQGYQLTKHWTFSARSSSNTVTGISAVTLWATSVLKLSADRIFLWCSRKPSPYFSPALPGCCHLHGPLISSAKPDSPKCQHLWAWLGFPGGSDSKESACNAGPRFDPWVWKMPWKRHGNPLQYSCLKNPWTEEPGRLQSKGSQRVRHDWATRHKTQIPINTFCWPYARNVLFREPL